MSRRVVTSLCALVTIAGVVLLAYRCSVATLGDGPVDFTPVAVMGLLVFVVPMAITALVVLDGRALTSLPISAVSVIASAVIATRRPGNMVGLWFPYTAVPSVGLMLIVGYTVRRLSRTPSA